MSTLGGSHQFRLYRSGYSGPEVRWDDNQQWASFNFVGIDLEAPTMVVLQPNYGSMATYFRLDLVPQESAETNWVSFLVRLIIDNLDMGQVPLSWYVGAPSDWPSGVGRFPEVWGPSRPPGSRPAEFPAGVWTLAVRRSR